MPQRPTVIDLFAGVGGLSLGALRAGFDLSLAVELDRNALSAHQCNFPGYKHSFKDVSNFDGEKLLNEAGLRIGELDGLIGGPPCQGFSNMGHRAVEDERNDLFVKFFSLVAQARPKFFVVENVLGILNAQYDGIRENAFAQVSGEYTLLEPIRIKASEFGAPTTRERAFFIGYLANDMQAFDVAGFEAKKVQLPTTVEQALHGLPVEIDSGWQREADSWRTVRELPESPFYERVVGHIPRGVGNEEAKLRYRREQLTSGCFGTRHAPYVAARYGALRHGQQDSVSKSIRLDPNGFCPTIRAGTGPDRGSHQAVRPIHPTQPRVITPREAARLQGFPDWFRFAPSKWHSFRQIGNSVSPIVAESVLEVIHSYL